MELHSEKIDLIMPALLLARKSFKAAIKDKPNDFFKSKYATLDNVIEAVNEAFLDNNILLTQPTEVVEGNIILHTRFIHVSGQWFGSTYPVHPIKNDPQAEGSATTYARRFSLMALAGIAPEDDDGNAATKAVTKQAKAVQDIAGRADDGCWEQSESVGWDRNKITQSANIALEYWDIQDAKGALEYLASLDMPSEAKIAMNTLFDSKFRAAMKKQHAINQEQL